MDTAATQITDSVEKLWGLARIVAGCAVCGQAHLIKPAQLKTPCPHCARGQLEPQPAELRPLPPELILPFRRAPVDLRPALQNFVNGLWLRPADFSLDKLLLRLRPVFWPKWLVDADVQGPWQAEAGFDYQVKSSQEAYTGAQWQTREVVETRIRWEPRLGQLQRHYDNLVTPALHQEAQLLKYTGAYPLDQAVPYDPAHLDEAALHLPDQHPENVWPLAQTQLQQAAAADCQRAAGAQHLRQFTLAATYGAPNWTQLLLPLYVTYYTDDAGKAQAVYVNGYTGQVGGVRLASLRTAWMWAGGIAAVAAVLLGLGLVTLLAAILLPPLAILGGLFVLAGLLGGALALAPPAWAWQWNRQNQPSPQP